MPKVVVEHKLFHNDDIVLTLEYPKDLSDYTDLSVKEIEERIEMFGRMLFDDILPKDRKDFRIEYDEEQEKWEFYIMKRTS